MTIAAFLLGGLAAFGASALATLFVAFVLPRCGHTTRWLDDDVGCGVDGHARRATEKTGNPCCRAERDPSGEWVTSPTQIAVTASRRENCDRHSSEPVSSPANQHQPPRKPRRRMIAAAHILPRAGLPAATIRAERGDDTAELVANLARAGASILSGERRQA